MEVKINLDEITAQMDELKDTKARYEFELKKVKEEIEKRELQLIALLNQMGVNEMQHGIYSFGLKVKQRIALDQKLLAQELPDIYNKYKTTKESESFEFKINS